MIHLMMIKLDIDSIEEIVMRTHLSCIIVELNLQK